MKPYPARFRNFFVNKYLSIKKDIYYKNLMEVFDILIKFLKEIKCYLKNENF